MLRPCSHASASSAVPELRGSALERRGTATAASDRDIGVYVSLLRVPEIRGLDSDLFGPGLQHVLIEVTRAVGEGRKLRVQVHAIVQVIQVGGDLPGANRVRGLVI